MQPGAGDENFPEKSPGEVCATHEPGWRASRVTFGLEAYFSAGALE